MFGCFTAQRHLDNRVTFKNVVIVTDVRDHTCEMAGHLVEKCKEYVDNLPSVTKVWLFSDCGKHFRIPEFVGYVYKSWCEALSATILLCFFIERHGKGRVDALFALFKRWLKNLLGVSEVFFWEPEELVAAMQGPATQANAADPEGAAHFVFYFSLAKKPPQQWRLEAPAPFIEETYCIQMNHRVQKICGKVALIRDRVFSDRAAVEQPTLSGVSCEGRPSSGEWRRGFYTQQTWNKKVPTKGSAFTLGSRMDAQQYCAAAAESSDDEQAPWELRYQRRVQHLLRRREKQLRVRTTAKA